MYDRPDFSSSFGTQFKRGNYGDRARQVVADADEKNTATDRTSVLGVVVIRRSGLVSMVSRARLVARNTEYVLRLQTSTGMDCF